MAKWIDVKTKLPPIETTVIGLCKTLGSKTVLLVSREVVDGEYAFNPVMVDGVVQEVAVEVTHWLPLSVLPQEDSFDLERALAGCPIINELGFKCWVIAKSKVKDNEYVVQHKDGSVGVRSLRYLLDSCTMCYDKE